MGVLGCVDVCVDIGVSGVVFPWRGTFSVFFGGLVQGHEPNGGSQGAFMLALSVPREGTECSSLG